ncbi:MAG: hypothetical protein P8101_22060 [Candidatus Thiodiazotropha sp.]
MKRSRNIPTVLAVLIALAYVAFHIWETTWYEGLIPVAIGINGTELIDGQSDFREGCGVAIFKLGDHTAVWIRSSGLAALTKAHEARSHPGNHYFTFGDWKETPYVITGDDLTLADRWLNGIGCASIGQELRQNIDKAMSARGSFYSTSSESGLLVIPQLSLVVLSYDG